MSAIAAVAEYKNRIQKIFLTQVPNEIGAYCLSLCVNGVFEEILLDDYFPCKANKNEPVFNWTNCNELWVMLLEKAWAKVHGGYANIDAGLARDALHDLTGAPTETFYTK